MKTNLWIKKNYYAKDWKGFKMAAPGSNYLE